MNMLTVYVPPKCLFYFSSENGSLFLLGLTDCE